MHIWYADFFAAKSASMGATETIIFPQLKLAWEKFSSEIINFLFLYPQKHQLVINRQEKMVSLGGFYCCDEKNIFYIIERERLLEFQTFTTHRHTFAQSQICFFFIYILYRQIVVYLIKNLARGRKKSWVLNIDQKTADGIILVSWM